jgi:hypothetical protein
VIGSLYAGAGTGPGSGVRRTPGRRAGTGLPAVPAPIVAVPPGGTGATAAAAGGDGGGPDPTAARPPLIATNAPAAPPASSRATPASGTSRDGVGTGGPLGANSSVNAPASFSARRLARS